MTKVSIWKRMGGWLRGTPTPAQTESSLDNERLILNNSQDQLDAETISPPAAEPTSLFHRRGKPDQVTAMEDGFNRLVEVLESINDHVVQQREISSSVRNHMEKLPNLLDGFSQTITGQRQLLTTMTEEIQQGNRLGRQQIDLLKMLPETAREQLAQLEQMQEHLEMSVAASREVAENITRQHIATDEMAAQSKTQTRALQELSELIRRDDERLETLLSRHTRRLTWLSVIAGALALVAVIIAFITWGRYHQ